MSENNIKLIKNENLDNFNLSEIQKGKNENNKEDKENKDKSFKKLFNLQLLIQKHSGLKELCKLKGII